MAVCGKTDKDFPKEALKTPLWTCHQAKWSTKTADFAKRKQIG